MWNFELQSYSFVEGPQNDKENAQAYQGPPDLCRATAAVIRCQQVSRGGEGRRPIGTLAALSVLARNFAELHAEKTRQLANLAEFSIQRLQIECAQVRNVPISLWLAPADV